MASKELMDKLNSAIARELQVSVQYIWQHVMATGLKAEPVKEVFKKIAITEMKHAEEVAERLDYLGGRPTTKPSPIIIGDSLKEMIENDKKSEEGRGTPRGILRAPGVIISSFSSEKELFHVSSLRLRSSLFKNMEV
jgi:bacterioferritin (cytochrome b1)